MINQVSIIEEIVFKGKHIIN